MNYNRLISLGCSLTHHHGWASRVAQALKIPLVNLAKSGGSNQLQVYKMQKMILENEVKPTDLIIWQITGSERKYLRLCNTPDNLKLAIKDSMNSESPTYEITNPNMFDNIGRINFLCYSTHALDTFRDKEDDSSQYLEDLLFMIKVSSYITKNILVIFGWQQALSINELDIFKTYLTHNNIDYINEPIVEWCHSKDLQFKDRTKTHPTYDSYAEYADKIILPKLGYK